MVTLRQTIAWRSLQRSPMYECGHTTLLLTLVLSSMTLYSIDDAVLVDVRAGLELHLVADERRPVELHADADLDALPHPDIALATSRDVAADLAVERVPVRLHVRLDRSDVTPVVVDDDAVQRLVAAEHRREDVLRPVGVRVLP